jgi:alginate O-acetyltransferase complex protein AlgI
VFIGLWHGANWTFLLWGAYHGAWIVLEKIIGEKKLEKIPKLFRQAFTFFLVVIGWVLFRSENLAHAGELLQKMFGMLPKVVPASITLWPSDILPGRVLLVGVLALIGVFFSSEKIRSRCGRSVWRLPVLFFALVLSVMSLARAEFNPFIYFRF